MSEHARLFMKLTGEDGRLIAGDASAMGMKGWIELEDWNWSMRRKSGQTDANAVEPTKLTFSKSMDKATHRMLRAMSTGEALTAMVKLDDASLHLFNLTLHLSKVRILDYKFSTQASDKSMSISEDWGFDYESILFEYRQDIQKGAVEVEILRPPGSSTDSPDETKRKFVELFTDLKVEPLESLWQEVLGKTAELRKDPNNMKESLEKRD